MFGWLRTAPSCPVDDRTRDWVHDRWAWLCNAFGRDRLRGVGLFRALYYLPTVVPSVAGVLLWVMLLNPDFGLFILRSERLFVAIRCGGVGGRVLTAHAHNDQLAVVALPEPAIEDGTLVAHALVVDRFGNVSLDVLLFNFLDDQIK